MIKNFGWSSANGSGNGNSTANFISAGLKEPAVVTDNGDGTVDIDALKVVLYSNDQFVEPLVHFDVSGVTSLVLTDNTNNYIYVDYNAGSPEIKVTTDKSLVNSSNRVPATTIFREGNVAHYILWDSFARGLPGKFLEASSRLYRFTRQNGLSISADASRNMFLSAGTIYAINLIPMDFDSFDSTVHEFDEWVYNGSGWDKNTVTQYDNTSYQGPSGKVTLANNKYVVVWMYRLVESTTGANHCTIIYSDEEYANVTDARNADEPLNRPPIVNGLGMLVGRALVQKDLVAEEVISTFDVTLSSGEGGITEHNLFPDLQGGQAGERYHVTKDQHDALVAQLPISTATIMYVDGDIGDDSNDGLTPATAKKTMSFLNKDDANSIGRQNTSSLIVNAKGTVLSSGTGYHTAVNNFASGGTITIVGETTDEATGIAVTAFENSNADKDYHSFIEASGESFTIDEHKKRFVVVTAGTGASANLYPIVSNTATVLEVMTIASLGVDSIIKIVSPTVFKGAQVSAPGVLLAYGDDNFFKLTDNDVNINVINVDLSECAQTEKIGLLNNQLTVNMLNCNIDVPLVVTNNKEIIVDKCYTELNSFNSWFIKNSVFRYTYNRMVGDGTGFGIYALDRSLVECRESRIDDQLIALYGNNDNVLSIQGNNIFNADQGIIAYGGKVNINEYAAAYIHFNENSICINMSGGDFLIGDACVLVNHGVGTDLQVTENETATFSDLVETKNINNSVTYVNNITYYPFKPDSKIQELTTVTQEPTGFPINTSTNEIDIAASVLSFVNLTRTFTIAPSGSSFDIYQSGKKYTISSAKDIIIPDVEGNNFFYFDEGVLKRTDVFNTDLISKYVYVANVYWDFDNKKIISDAIGDERHGVKMDAHTHLELHYNVGSYLISGGGLTNLDVDGSGDDASNAQFGIEAAEMRDEDIPFDHSAILSTAGLDVFYKDGAAGNWRSEQNAGFSILSAVAGRPYYNEFTGAVWQKTEIVNNDFVLYHIFMVNSRTLKAIAVMGQADHPTISAARQAAQNEIYQIDTSGLAFQEFVPIGTVIIQGSSSYTNAVKGRLRSTADGSDYYDWRNITIQPSESTGSLESNNNLLAAVEIETTNDTPVVYVIKNQTTSPSGEFEAVRFNIASTDRYAKLTFTAVSDKAQISIECMMDDIGGTSETWFGLHNAATTTNLPLYGWKQIIKDAEASIHDIKRVTFIMKNLTVGDTYTVYVHAISTAIGSELIVGRDSTSTWSNIDVPGPMRITANDFNVTITTNPTI